MSRCHQVNIEGHYLLFFEGDDREELKTMISWFRSTLGKSHGPFISAWWVTSPPAGMFEIFAKKVIAMKPGPHSFAARMVWA